MKIEDLKKYAKKYKPAVTLEFYFGDVGNGLFSFIIFGSTIVLGVVSLVSLIAINISSDSNWLGSFAMSIVQDFNQYFRYIYGLFFISLSIELPIQALKYFFDSYAFLDLEVSDLSNENNQFENVTYEAASMLLESLNKDSVLAFINSPAGSMAIYRLGLSEKDLKNFIRNRVKPFTLGDVVIRESELYPLSFKKLAAAVVSNDYDLSIFLASRRISPDNFTGAATWAEHILRGVRFERRWWSREKLGRIPGIGKNWAYGEISTLARFSTPIRNTPYFTEAFNVLAIRKKEVMELENILLKIRGANALVVADSDEEAMNVISALGLMIERGSVMPKLENKQIFILDYTTLIGSTKEKTLFESKMMTVLTDSVKAGNIIIAIKDLPGLIKSATQIGSDILSILEWYFNSPDIHIIATTSNYSFHEVIENNNNLMRHLEKVLLKGVEQDSLLNYLMDEALRIEAEVKVWFLYQAVSEAADSAERFFFGSNTEDKASDLLLEAATGAKSVGVKVIGREDIMRLVESKTGIPRQTNDLKTDNSILLNLEQLLSNRIVGQEEAIKAISGAMKRAHTGIGNPNRPLGSFLFLGPTGVGKTETTKALADAFFGGESAIIRFDMSEFRTSDALERLIGNFTIGKPGVLSSALRDKPYGVLLLDEFEKTSRDVIDLFLQVLDEGFFSDMSGKKVSARNLIIIATSNAGSEFIWKATKQSGGTYLNKDVIISAIIEEGIFKPELLNRFDGVIAFHPLTRNNLMKIAELMLAKLNKRLVENGLAVEITSELINALVEKGTDPTFGARPMNRAIQDKVETFIADKILRGEAPPGSKISFTQKEIEAIRD